MNQKIRANPLFKSLLVLSVILFLVIPVVSVRFFCGLYLLVYIFSYWQIRTAEKSLFARHSVRTLRLAKGERVTVTVFIENHSFLPLSLCYLYDSTGSLSVAADEGRTVFSLRPYEVRTFSYSIHAGSRGAFTVGPIAMECTDWSGIFTLTTVFDDTVNVIVRPARSDYLLELTPLQVQGSLYTQNPSFEDITMRRSVRPYQNGDEMRRINWTTSARMGSFYTNEFLHTFNCPVFVLLNLCAQSYPLEKRYEYTEKAVEQAAAVIEQISLYRQNCGFACYGSVEGINDNPFVPSGDSSLEKINSILDMLSIVQRKDYSAENENPDEFENRIRFMLPTGVKFIRLGPESVCTEGELLQLQGELPWKNE